MVSKRLEGSVSIVTGSSRGIGKAIAIEFARHGAKSIVTYHRERAQAESVQEEIVKQGGHASVIRVDVTSRKSIRELFKTASDRYGKIDVLVNNAGINEHCFFKEITDESWDRIMSVNLKGPFICSQEVFPYMIKQKWGRIINISSSAGQYFGPKTVHYSVSKSGLIGLTKVVARYGAEHNILVNAVAPGIILTDQTRVELASKDGDTVINMTLLKKAGELSDVASTCLLLASKEQSYITGQVISVSGGAVL